MTHEREARTNPLVLLVEDDEFVNEGNRRVLGEVGIDTIAVTTLALSLDVLQQHIVEAIVLDIVMPDGDGTEWVWRLRELSDAPILFLTGKTEKVNMMEGYRVGGIDYITKPYDIDIFAAKVSGLINARFPKARTVPSWEMVIGDLRMDSVAARAYVSGKDMKLTGHEFAILTCLVSQNGHVIADKELFEMVWSSPYMPGDAHLLRKHISNIRRKLSDVESEHAIVNVYGKGYRFDQT
jgi:DNA-binding response OmpR family regulator